MPAINAGGASIHNMPSTAIAAIDGNVKKMQQNTAATKMVVNNVFSENRKACPSVNQ
jgi:hypothetical protein